MGYGCDRVCVSVCLSERERERTAWQSSMWMHVFEISVCKEKEKLGL